MRDLAMTFLAKNNPREKALLGSAPRLMAGLMLAVMLVGCGGDTPSAAGADRASLPSPLEP